MCVVVKKEVMKKEILIIGGGTAGITTAAQIKKTLGEYVAVTIVDPASKHYYQPQWTLVGGGVIPHEKTQRLMSEVIPKNVTWIQDEVISFEPEQNTVLLKSSRTLSYDVLIVAAGIQLDWYKIKGAVEALSFDNVCSNFIPGGSSKTWEVLNRVQSGNALFTQPPLPIKCPGAPQKAVYLADDFFRRKGIRDKVQPIFANHGPRIFGVEKYRVSLEKLISRKEIITMFEHNLVEVRPKENIAVFEKGDKSLVEVSYSMIHIVPPMSSPDFIKKSVLANEEGWVDVDKHTLQHKKFSNVFSLGDCSSLPTSKTGAAIRKQAPVLVANLLSYLKGSELKAKYDGYTSCPLVTGYGKVIMAEFDYEGHPQETFPFDQSKERWSMWLVKAHLLPMMYWEGMLKGRA